MRISNRHLKSCFWFVRETIKPRLIHYSHVLPLEHELDLSRKEDERSYKVFQSMNLNSRSLTTRCMTETEASHNSVSSVASVLCVNAVSAPVCPDTTVNRPQMLVRDTVDLLFVIHSYIACVADRTF